ncbi:SCO family protein [Alteripontixanthobacter maritimus]|nr:SCO family protein [Alteripontixanthobacter maritimus]
MGSIFNQTTAAFNAMLVSLAALALAACGPTPDRAETEGVRLEGAAVGGPFELTSETGETVRWSDWDGKYRIVYFGYTYCPDVCPVDTQKIARALAALKAEQPDLAAKIVPLFITIDPARDTPAVLTEFTDAFSPDMIGLTGTEDQITAVTKSYAASYARGEELDGGQYLMNHTNLAYLMGPDGAPLVAFSGDMTHEAITRDLLRWVE